MDTQVVLGLLFDCREDLKSVRQAVGHWRYHPEASVVDEHEARFVFEKLREIEKRIGTIERRLRIADTTGGAEAAP